MSRKDRIAARLSLLCALVGLPRDAWFTMTIGEFLSAVRKRCAS